MVYCILIYPHGLHSTFSNGIFPMLNMYTSRNRGVEVPFDPWGCTGLVRLLTLLHGIGSVLHHSLICIHREVVYTRVSQVSFVMPESRRVGTLSIASTAASIYPDLDMGTMESSLGSPTHQSAIRQLSGSYQSAICQLSQPSVSYLSATSQPSVSHQLAIS